MKTSTDCRSLAKIFKAFLFTLILSAGFFASANAQTLSSNQFGYAPGDVVTLTATGFQAGETVTVQVVNADGSPNSNDAPWNVTADGSGGFVTTWTVPADSSSLGQLLLATADGQSSALHAEATFVDAGFSTLDFQQASNQDHPSVPISWINGILNPNNSDYFEGLGVPQRVIFTGLQATPGDTHALNFRHQALKGGVHAYDFLMGWPQAILVAGAIAQGPVNELQDLVAQTCNGAISSAGLGACTTATNVLAIECPDNMGDPAGVTCGFPPPLSVNPAITCFESTYGNRFIHVDGNQPVTWGELIFNGYTGSGDVYATYTLRWKSTSDKIVIKMAGRSSQSCTTAGCCGYGAGCGAGAVAGGPYHFKLDGIDGVTTGSQDNQLQATPAPASPVCDSVVIAGPDSVCPASSGNIYTATYTGLCANITHHWSITGAGTIVGPTTGASISVLAGNFCGSQFSICDTIVCTEGQVVCCRVINVVDHVPPVITCPNPTSSVECPNTPNFGSASATDNCDTSVGITADDVTTPGNCAQEYSVTRTWTASDNCNNTSSCSRTISVTDNTAPVITCPSVSNVECPNTPSFGAATATDACDTLVVPTFADVTTAGACAQEYSVTRTWTATDDCGNSSTCSRTISVSDNTAPTITCPNPAASIECPNSPNFGSATASDLCDPSVVPTFSTVTTPGNCPQEFSVTRTWTATDDCGNSSTCSRTISVTDNTAPTITCPTVSSPIECPSSPSFGAATASDLCDPSVVPTFSTITTPGNCPQEFSVTRTWTATDDCGNSSTCSRTISVTDNTAPTITCPTVSNVECPNPIIFGAATATDLCDPSVVPTFSDVTTSGNCPFTVTRTWTATDDCGNSSTCSRTISVTDNTPPSITCPNPAATVECPNTPSFGPATASDACDISVDITASNVTTPGNCPQEFSVTRTWTATDDCGNTSTCSRTISVTDNTAPTITCPTVSNVECPASPSFGAATASDLCDPSVIPTFSTITTPGNCPQEFSVTRTWTATDDCGNSSTCSRTISVTDNTAPTITCPTVSNVECPASPSFGAATASDLCDPSVIPTFADATTPGNCPQEFSVTRTWTATDDCGNSSTCSRTISVTDNTAPTITCPNPASTVECPNSPNFGAATASDLCDPSVIPTFSTITTPGNCPQEFSVTRTWTATDDCGNSSTCSRTISVTDNTAPTITCPNPAASIECPNSPNFGSATASDLCDPSVVPTFSTITTPGNCPQEFSVTRTWTATDDCGNSSTCSRTISVTDNTAPTITCPNPAASIECPNTPNFGSATASDLCDPSVVPTFSTITTPGNCPQEFSVTRTWTATDDCGNSSTCSRTISVTDNTAPTITCPTVSNVECPASPSFGAATASDLCDPSVVPTFSTITTPGNCSQEFSVTRTWTATDDCGNSSTCSRTISVTDNTAPTITCPSVSNVECPNTPSFGSATASDLCDPSVTPTFADATTPGNCPQEFSVTRTWTATDDCGNSSTCSRTISVTDNTPPTLSCAANETINCNDPVIFTDPTPSDLCDPNVSFAVFSTSDTTYADGSQDHCTTWEATDACGNSSQCTQCIHVNPCVQDLFCSYTQGFWGNSGGHDCTGADKLTLINQLLSTPLIIGCNGNTMTFGVGEGQCVIDRLPGGGPSVAITGNNTCNSIVGIALHSGTPARFRNTLLAQTIALELNIRYSTGLGNVQITGQYMTTVDAQPCDTPNAAPVPNSEQLHTIPQTVITYLGANNTVADLLVLANNALCGAYVPSPGNPTLTDINSALDAFNEGFDECRFLVGFSNTLRAGTQVVNHYSPISLTAYPNPFNTSTIISFSMDKSYDNLKLEIFNATGEVVAVPFNGSTEEGATYTVEFDGNNYPAGVYIYRISAGTDTYFDKLILIK